MESILFVMLGALSVRFFIIMPIFFMYQLIDMGDVNLFVDLLEFFIGYIAAHLLLFYNKYHRPSPDTTPGML